MDAAKVLQAFPEIRIAYGQSDEYSFVLHKSCQLYGRRASKLCSLLCSLFATANGQSTYRSSHCWRRHALMRAQSAIPVRRPCAAT